jgi:hypothetical protein
VLFSSLLNLGVLIFHVVRRLGFKMSSTQLNLSCCQAKFCCHSCSVFHVLDSSIRVTQIWHRDEKLESLDSFARSSSPYLRSGRNYLVLRPEGHSFEDLSVYLCRFNLMLIKRIFIIKRL